MHNTGIIYSANTFIYFQLSGKKILGKKFTFDIILACKYKFIIMGAIASVYAISELFKIVFVILEDLNINLSFI